MDNPGTIKPLTEQEVRALFESSFLGITSPEKVVPQDVFFKTLEEACTDPRKYSLVPILLQLHKSLYGNGQLGYYDNFQIVLDHDSKELKAVEGGRVNAKPQLQAFIRAELYKLKELQISEDLFI